MNITYQCPRCRHRRLIDSDDDTPCEVCSLPIDADEADLALLDAEHEERLMRAEDAADRQRDNEYFNNL